jgi:CubicO group peptidase (beta-lactamase class C family)
MCVLDGWDEYRVRRGYWLHIFFTGVAYCVPMASIRALALVLAVAVSSGQAERPPSSPDVVAGEVGRRVDDYLTRLVPYGFSGSVLIARDGAILLEKGYGLANRAAAQPYRADTIASIGSITKQFTGAAIVKLEMDGRLKASDPIAKYLPNVPADKAGITIHHLLTHTAGFPGEMGGGDAEAIGRDALVARVLSTPLEAAPGARFEYSNEGYSLAGAIVEIVSGQGYEAYLREHLFLPARMRDTGYLLPKWPIGSLAIGYDEEGREWGRIYQRGWLPDGPGWYLRANGGIHSTVGDLYRWHLALSAPGLFSSAALEQYQTGHVPTPFGGERYAYGWGVEQTRRGTRVVSHNGGNGIFFADFRRYIDEGVVIIAMTNQPVIRGTELPRRQLESLVFDDAPVVMPPTPVDVGEQDRAALAGRYALDGGTTLVVRSVADGLEIESSDPATFAEQPLTAPGGRFAELEARSVALVQELAKDNAAPLHAAFDDGRPLEVVQGNQRRIWAEWRAESGEFQGVEAMGTAMVQGDPAVIVRLAFARGARTLQFIWGPRRLLGWRGVPGPGPARLVAESPRAWVFYRYRMPHAVRVTFDGEGGVTVTRADQALRGARVVAR